MKQLPEGIYVAIVTPMHADETINHDELANQVERHIQAGMHAVFCLGTNGEFYALSYEEKLSVIRTVLKVTDGRRPVFAGAGCITTAETIQVAQEAEKLGVSGISVISPFFVALTQEQLHDHFKAVAESVALPVILYNIPSRTGNDIEADTVARLTGIPNVAGIKDSSGKLSKVESFIDIGASDFSVFAGSDSLVLPGLQAGARGSVSGLANVVPELLVEIFNAWKSGKSEDAEAAQARLSRVRAMLSFGNPNTVTKQAVNVRGYPVGPARQPVAAVPPEVIKKIHEILEEEGYAG